MACDGFLLYRRIHVLMSLLTVTQAQLDTSDFTSQVNELTHQILGASKFQEYIDTSVTYVTGLQDPQEILNKLTDDLKTKVGERVEAVTNLQLELQSSFSKFGNNAVYPDCCDCCQSRGDESVYLKFKSEKIDTSQMCHTGQGTKLNTERRFPTSAVNDVMKKNLDDNPNLKWQYFGGEDGIMSIYPANVACDDKFDPRYRPWYSHTAFPVPKDVVIVIDKSGSMDKVPLGYDKSLIDTAKEAAKTVIDTLGGDDRAAVVYFSTSAETIYGDCHSTELALMTSENKAYLNKYVEGETAGGKTNYGDALSRAFDYFDGSTNKPKNDVRERIKVILFLTDGEPTDEDFLIVIADRNRIHNNQVVLLTFGFGSDLSNEAKVHLQNMANQISNYANAGTTKRGRFVYVRDPTNLRYQMATYYDFFSEEYTVSEVTVSIPYLDAFGLGLITSICLPVRTNNVFRGVTCIDVTLSDLFSDAIYFSRGMESYAFILDAQTRLLIHPLLPRPSDVYDHPVILRVQDLEQDPAMIQIANDSFIPGMPGEVVLETIRVLSRGDSEHDGVNTIRLSSTYIWQKLGLAELTVCVVIGKGDQNSGPTTTNKIQNFPYHRLDITKPDQRCRYINRMAITDISTIKFAPFAFSSPDYYLESVETQRLINQYRDHFLANDEAPFRKGIEDALDVSVGFDESIDVSDMAWQHSVWRYVGLREGIFRLFPGAKLVAEYDHTVRPWYKRAVSQVTTTTFSQPYVDAFGAGIVITLSKAVFETKAGVHTVDDLVAGVVGMDFTMDLFNSYVSKLVKACTTDKCFVIDNAGYVIAHPDFEGVHEGEADSVENIHISQKEEAIGRYLVDNDIMKRDGCINYNKRQIQTFWRITRSSVSDTGMFEMKSVQGSNIYIIHVTGKLSGRGCDCPFKKGSNISVCKGSGCECPCYTRDNIIYDTCTSSFTFGELQYPPCAPPVPAVNLEAVAKEEEEVIKDLKYCYPVKEVCPKKKDKLLSRDCSATAGCIWCGSNCQVRKSKGCGIGDVPLVAIVVPIVVVVVILFAIIICCLYKKRLICHNTKSNHAAPTSAAVGHDNPTMSSEMPDIRQQAGQNPAFGRVAQPPPSRLPPIDPAYQSQNEPKPTQYQPYTHPIPVYSPPAYDDAFKDPVYNVT